MTLVFVESIVFKYRSCISTCWIEDVTIDEYYTKYSRNLKRRRGRSTCYSQKVPSLSLILVFVFRLLAARQISRNFETTFVHANPYRSCFLQLEIADSNNDGILTQSEYQDAVEKMSGGNISSSDDLPIGIEKQFSSRLASTASGLEIKGVRDTEPGSANDSLLQTFCDSVYLSILEETGALNSTVSESRCFFAMSVADANRDNAIEQDSEYTRYVNQIGNNKYGFGIGFSDLPEPVQEIFTDFSNATTKSINIDGSKRGTTPTDDQKDELLKFCYHTAIAILEGDNPNISTNSTGNVTEVDGGTFEAQFTYLECTRGMAITDRNRDNLLSTDDYFLLVNRLSNNKFEDDDYDSLPSSLKETFSTFATSTNKQIDIDGSKPGQAASTEQTQSLTKLCTAIDKAILSGETSSPNVTIDNVNAIPFDACKKNMTIADSNRDDKLNQVEYVRFVSRISTAVATSSTFSSLDSKLQENFYALAGSQNNDATIDVFGSKPNQVANEDQNAALKNICDATGNAFASNGTVPASTVNVTINNIFLISSSIQLEAQNLNEPDNFYRKTLEAAYIDFLTAILSNFTDTANTTQKSQNRRLRGSGKILRVGFVERINHRYLSGVGLQLESAAINMFEDVTCPGNISATRTCLLVFGSFVTKVDVHNGTIRDTLIQELTNFTQGAIGTLGQSDGPFRQKLIEYNSTIEITVEAASDAQIDADSEPNTGGGGTSAGIVAGVIIILVVVFGICVWTCHQKRSAGLKSSSFLDSMGLFKFITKTKKNDVSKSVGTEDDEGNYEPNQIDGGKKSVGFAFGSSDGPGITDNEESNFNVREQEQAPKDEEKGGGRSDQPGGGGLIGKVFRRGQGGSKDEIGQFGEGFDNNDDFANYIFDDPAESKHMPTDFANGSDPFGISTSTGWKVEGQTDVNWGGVTDWTTGGGKTGFVEENFSERGSDDEDEGSDYESGSETEAPKKAVGSSHEGDVATNVNQLDALVDNGNWGGVAPNFESNLNDDDDTDVDEKDVSEDGRSESSEEDDDAPPVEVKDNDSFAAEDFDDISQHSSIIGLTQEEMLQREEYRKQVEDLVRKTCPDEIDNIDSMMSQFAGREPELVNTLKTMYDRSASQKALKAVHKSKAIPEREGRAWATAGADGSAVIAAACMLNSDANRASDYDDGSYSGSYDSRGDGSGSYTSGRRSHSGSGSYDDEEGSYTGSRSYDDERSRTESGRSERSRTESGRSERSHTESGRSGSRSYDDRGSHSDSRHSDDNDDDDGSYTGRRTDDGSLRSGSKARKNDDEDQSYAQSEGSGSRSYYSEDGDGSKSHDSRSRQSRSYRSNSDSGSGSYSGSGSFN